MWLAVLGLVLLEVVAEMLLHRWARSRRGPWLVVGICAYVLLAIVFAIAMQSGLTMTRLNTAWQCANVVVAAACGVFLLQERLTGVQWVGVVFATLATALMLHGT